jgi:thioredoxin-related protein
MRKTTAIFLLMSVLALCNVNRMLQAQNEPPEAKPEAVAQAEAGWLTSLEEAQKLAQAESKEILIDFTGSDWCGWCIKLSEEVFATPKWQQEAAKKYVMVMIDFPHNKPVSSERKAYNDRLASEFGIESFPTIFLTDAAGKPYAKTGYEAGGAENYLQHLAELGKQKEQRAQRFSEIEKENEPQKKLELLDKLIATLDQWEVSLAYPELKAQIVALDQDNKAGLLVKYGIALAQYYHNKGETTRCEEFLQKVGKCDAKKAEEFKVQLMLRTIPSLYFEKNDWQGAQVALAKIMEMKLQGEAAQEMYYYASLVEYRLENKEKCLEYLHKALECAPQSQAASYLEKVLKKLKEQE